MFYAFSLGFLFEGPQDAATPRATEPAMTLAGTTVPPASAPTPTRAAAATGASSVPQTGDARPPLPGQPASQFMAFSGVPSPDMFRGIIENSLRQALCNCLFFSSLLYIF